MRKTLLPLLLFATIAMGFSSCLKKADFVDVCDSVAKTKIVATKTSYYVGEEIKLTGNDADDVYYSWYHSNSSGSLSNYSDLTISSCTKSHQGWFYLTGSNPDCTSHTDSVYITVTNNPALPPCTPPNNSMSFSLLSSISSGTGSWFLDGTYGCMNLRLSQGSSSYLNIYFHNYWNGKDPEDGAYNIINVPSFGSESIYSVYINTVYSSIYFVGNPGKVYVTHAGGKVQVTLCNNTLSGSLGGPSFSSTATGKITAP